MPSQTDLDQGGTDREWVKQYLGPTVGWVWVPARNALTITAPGTYTIDLSTNLVRVNVVGAVTIVLPSTIIPTNPPAGALPGVSVRAQITIVDIGGNAAAHPITIQPASVAETIMNLTQIQITSNYGGFILQPNAGTKTWTNAQ